MLNESFYFGNYCNCVFNFNKNKKHFNSKTLEFLLKACSSKV